MTVAYFFLNLLSLEKMDFLLYYDGNQNSYHNDKDSNDDNIRNNQDYI